jgi:hypothetical protein
VGGYLVQLNGPLVAIAGTNHLPTVAAIGGVDQKRGVLAGPVGTSEFSDSLPRRFGTS